jgi:hypothetical protein
MNNNVYSLQLTGTQFKFQSILSIFQAFKFQNLVLTPFFRFNQLNSLKHVFNQLLVSLHLKGCLISAQLLTLSIIYWNFNAFSLDYIDLIWNNPHVSIDLINVPSFLNLTLDSAICRNVFNIFQFTKTDPSMLVQL